MPYDNLTPELVSEVKDYFLNNNIEMTELAKRSKELFGKKINHDKLVKLSDQDPDGTWYFQRQSLGKSMSYQEEIEMVRKVVFKALLRDDTPASAVASLTKAWLDLSKSTENGRASSAKTSPERTIELAKIAMQQLKDYELDTPEPE